MKLKSILSIKYIMNRQILSVFIIIFIIIIIIQFINFSIVERYMIIPEANTMTDCATKCKKTVNCYGFELTPGGECRLHGDTLKMDDRDIPSSHIICNKEETIDKYKFNGVLSREHKKRNSIYDCKSYNSFTKVFNNGDQNYNINGKNNFEIGNTLIDYDLDFIGPII